MNFCQFWNRINGEPYTDGVPPPVEYQFQSLTTGPINGSEQGSTWELKPIAQEDTARYAFDDVVDAYAKLHKGKDPRLLGPPMTDGEFKKFMGHTW